LSHIDALEDIEAFVIDLDGVVYLRKQAIPGATRFFDELISGGKRFVFLTNNSSRTRREYVKILSGIGIRASLGDIVTSAYATARYVSERAKGSRVHVVGGSGLIEELSEAGMEVVNEPPVRFVIAGIDFAFTYEKLALASKLLRGGARFIATNRDATYPTEEGPLPGAGSIVSAIMTASGKRPMTVGKPNGWIFDICSGILRSKPGKIAVVGDRLETDILGGQRAGMRTILVLSGVTRKEDLPKSRVRPDLVVPSIADLIRGK